MCAALLCSQLSVWRWELGTLVNHLPFPVAAAGNRQHGRKHSDSVLGLSLFQLKLVVTRKGCPFVICPGQDFQSYDKHHFGEERVYLVCISQSIVGNQGWNSNKTGPWRQELMQRLWSDAVSWFAPCSLLSLFSDSTQDHQPRGATAPSALGPPTSITN